MVASSLPWMFNNIFHVANIAPKGIIADNVRYSFYIGAFFFFGAVLYTVFTTKEYPPEDIDFRKKVKESSKGFGGGLAEILSALRNMPPKDESNCIDSIFYLAWIILNVVLLCA